MEKEDWIEEYRREDVGGRYGRMHPGYQNYLGRIRAAEYQGKSLVYGLLLLKIVS